MATSDSPRVSFIVPCYNQGPFVEEALRSALAQRGVEPEVIAVNDGSTDTTEAILRSMGGIRVIHQRNQGLAAARNAGLEMATGEFVVWLDADDRLLPDHAAELSHACRRDGCEFAYCDFEWIDASGNKTGEKRHHVPLPGSRSLLPDLMHGGLFPPVTALARRTALTPFPLGMDGYADYAVLLDASLRGARFSHVPKVLASYRKHGDSMSNRLEEMEAAHRKALSYAASRNPEAFFEMVQSLQREGNALRHLHLHTAPPQQRAAQLAKALAVRLLAGVRFRISNLTRRG